MTSLTRDVVPVRSRTRVVTQPTERMSAVDRITRKKTSDSFQKPQKASCDAPKSQEEAAAIRRRGLQRAGNPASFDDVAPNTQSPRMGSKNIPTYFEDNDNKWNDGSHHGGSIPDLRGRARSRLDPRVTNQSITASSTPESSSHAHPFNIHFRSVCRNALQGMSVSNTGRPTDRVRGNKVAPAHDREYNDPIHTPTTAVSYNQRVPQDEVSFPKRQETVGQLFIRSLTRDEVLDVRSFISDREANTTVMSVSCANYLRDRYLLRILPWQSGGIRVKSGRIVHPIGRMSLWVEVGESGVQNEIKVLVVPEEECLPMDFVLGKNAIKRLRL